MASRCEPRRPSMAAFLNHHQSQSTRQYFVSTLDKTPIDSFHFFRFGWSNNYVTHGRRCWKSNWFNRSPVRTTWSSIGSPSLTRIRLGSLWTNDTGWLMADDPSLLLQLDPSMSEVAWYLTERETHTKWFRTSFVFSLPARLCIDDVTRRQKKPIAIGGVIRHPTLVTTYTQT